MTAIKKQHQVQKGRAKQREFGHHPGYHVGSTQILLERINCKYISIKVLSRYYNISILLSFLKLNSVLLYWPGGGFKSLFLTSFA